jgi:hypothetical protein
MKITLKEIALVGVLVPAAIAVLSRRAEGTESGWINTCQGVGCHGGQPGCFWYNLPNGKRIFCFAVRP